MPEGPEVQTVVSTLEKQLLGVSITSCHVYYPRIVEQIDFETRIINQTFEAFDRLGKFMVIKLTNDYLIVHLRMEGKFYIDSNSLVDKHTHVVIGLSDGRYLKYHDTRKFGRLGLVKDSKQHNGIKQLGLELDDPLLTVEYLKQKYRNKSIPIKQALLDQSIMTSIGNIYANEICFRAKVHPLQPCQTLSSFKIRRILEESRAVIDEAIAMGGTTIRSYTSSLNVHGRFTQKLCVHQQSQCPHCQSPIKKIYVNKRGTYFCPKCQRLKK